MPDEVKLEEGYSLVKGLKKALVAVVIPALGTAVVALLGDPEFVAALQAHLGKLAGGGVLTFALAFIVNWVKNRNK